DLAGVLRTFLEADHPQGHHRGRIVSSPSLHLDRPVLGRVQAQLLLWFGDDCFGVEAVLADGAALRPGEDPGLQGRDPHLAVEAGAPGFLVLVDPEVQASAVEVTVGASAFSRTPVREVVGKPAIGVESARSEAVVEDRLVCAQIHLILTVNGKWRHLAVAPLSTLGVGFGQRPSSKVSSKERATRRRSPPPWPASLPWPVSPALPPLPPPERSPLRSRLRFRSRSPPPSPRLRS